MSITLRAVIYVAVSAYMTYLHFKWQRLKGEDCYAKLT